MKSDDSGDDELGHKCRCDENMRINTHILSLTGQHTLSQTTRAIARAMERLASGQRINSARDDVAGISISNRLEAQRRGWMQVVRNVNDTQGLFAAADGALDSQIALVQRMRELALQSSNGTLTYQERAALNSEFQDLYEEFTRISEQTEFAGIKLLDASFTTRSLQVGLNKGETIDFNVKGTRAIDVFGEVNTLGLGTFKNRTTYTTGSAPGYLTQSDFNGDGILDIAVGDITSASVSVFIGNGNGTFQARQILAAGATTQGVIADDFNADGRMDIAAVSTGTTLASIFIGNGNGTFQTRKTYTTGSGPAALASGDYNEDGIADLVIVDQTSATISIGFGNGNGTFTPRITKSIGATGTYVEDGDFNADGHIDLAVSDYGNSTVSIFLSNGNGTFQNRTTVQTGTNPYSVNINDFNADGILDIAVPDYTDNTVSVLLGNGNGTFQSRRSMSVGANPFFVSSADLNGDGILDLINSDALNAANGNTISIMLGNGNGTFKTRTTIAAATGPRGVIAGDYNGDGVPDLANVALTSNWLNINLSWSTTSKSVADFTIETQEDASNILEILDSGLIYLNSARADIGAIHSRLDYSSSNALSLLDSTTEAKSQIMDVDFAIEVAELVRLQILQNAGVAVLAQANLNLKLVLELLK